MKRAVSYEIAKVGQDDIVTIAGPIDEHFLDGTRDLTKQLGRKVVLDLQGILHINSIGKRSWLEFFRVVRSKNLQKILC